MTAEELAAAVRDALAAGGRVVWVPGGKAVREVREVGDEGPCAVLDSPALEYVALYNCPPGDLVSGASLGEPAGEVAARELSAAFTGIPWLVFHEVEAGSAVQVVCDNRLVPLNFRFVARGRSAADIVAQATSRVANMFYAAGQANGRDAELKRVMERVGKLLADES